MWFPKRVCAEPFARQRMDFLATYLGKVDFRTWIGGLQVRGITQEFFVNFIDYPFLSRQIDLELVSQQASFVMKMIHHLSVICFSSDDDLLARFESMAAQKGILVHW